VLGTEDLLAWFERLRLSESSRSVVRQIRSSDPARRVGGGHRNVSGRYPSRKMGVTIQFESHRVELAAIYEFEHDPDVLEYWDQPPSFKMEYKSAHGKRIVVFHTPDYFVIRTAGAGWEECKTEEDLAQWAVKSPNRYVSSNGEWHCPPGETFAREFGLIYRVRSSANINWTYQRNIQFLEDYLRSDVPCVATAIQNLLIAHVSAQPGLSLQELLSASRGAASPDDIYTLLAAEDLYVDLYAVALAEPDSVPVFLDRAAASVYAKRHPVSEALAYAGTRCPDADCKPSEVMSRLYGASPDDLQCGNDRLRVVRAHWDAAKGADDQSRTSKRTRYRWVALYQKAENVYGNGYLGLLPQTRKRGNRTDKLPEATRKLMAEYIAVDYESLKQKSIYASWITLKAVCGEQQLLTPSYETFRLAVRGKGGHDQTFKRVGPRAAYSQEPFYWELELTTPRHGDRPFEIGHIDHTELDIELICSVTGRNLGRPWLSLLTDAFSRRVLAFYLSFDPPSYRACMMIIRECVCRHGRLPHTFVVDGGSEFGSIYFETLLARYECIKKTRPAAKARFGSVVERLFGTCNTQLVHNLQGNTQIMRNVRQVTKSVNPKQHAVWTLPTLNARLCEYFYDVYDRREHPALGQSPSEAYHAGLSHTGQRQHRLVVYDREFLILTLPTTAAGTAMVLPCLGVKIRYIYYWCDLFRNPEIERRQVPIRYDPFDAGVAFAFVKNQWVQCHSEYYAILKGRSEREIMLATQQLRRKRQMHQLHGALSAKKIGDFLRSIEAEELLLGQRLRDQQAQGSRPLSARLPVAAIEDAEQQDLSPSTSTVLSHPEITEETETYGAF